MLGGAAVKGRPFLFPKIFDLYLLMFLCKQYGSLFFPIFAFNVELSKL